MLRLGTALLVALATALASAPTTRAVTVDMSFPGFSDVFQVIPLAPDRETLTGGNQWSRGIALPDGSVLYNNTDPTHSMTRKVPGGNGPITTYPALPSGQMPSHFARGGDGRVWFTEAGPPTTTPGPVTTPAQDLIGRLDTATGAIIEFGGLSAGANAQSIAPGPDGNIWFLEFGTNSVGRITPAGAVTEFPLPPGVRLSATRGEELTAGPGGDLYFLVSGGIGRMTAAGTYVGRITGGLTDFAPNAIAYGWDGNLWATECQGDSLARISPTGTVSRVPQGTFPRRSCPMGIVADPDGRPWLYTWNAGQVGRLLFDSPLARTDDPAGVEATAADLNGSATPRGAATSIHFEYGTTTTYGRTTAEQAIGDGDGGVDVTARPEDLQPLTSYHYRLVATSVVGTAHGADQTVTTGPLPPPPPPPLPVDRDGDGYPETVDCDDLSAAIHPGAKDKPGDRIDQDCSGADAAYERFQPRANAGWKVVHGRIVFTRMVIDEMPAGSRLKLSCSGRGCPRTGYTATIAKPVKRLDVAKRLKGARLHKGAKVELTLSRPGFITTIVRWTIGPPPRVTVLCQPPGAEKPGAC